MTKLSININKIATIRNARGGNIPDVLLAASKCEEYGADGITVHPRPDQRHIRYADVYSLKEIIKTEFNIEGYPSKDFLELIIKVKPQQVTFVPDSPDALTSNAGWNVRKNISFLKEIVAGMKKYGIRTSLFVDTDLNNIEYAAHTGTHRIELYTEPYAANYPVNRVNSVKPFVTAAEFAAQCGLEINAGHDLSLANLGYFRSKIKDLKEVSIGHALISDALYYGLKKTIRFYKKKLND